MKTISPIGIIGLLLVVLIILLGIAFYNDNTNESVSLTQQVGKRFRTMQDEFEKGYKTDTSEWITIDTVIIDTVITNAIKDGRYRYYKFRVVPPKDGIIIMNYFINDSVYQWSKKLSKRK